MTKSNFDAQMGMIMNVFGTAEYTKERNKLIWDACEDLTDKSFAYIVKTFLRTRKHNHPPLPIDFEEAAHSQRKVVQNYANNSMFEKIEERGPEKMKEILAGYGANSLEEAVMNSKKLKLVKNEGA